MYAENAWSQHHQNQEAGEAKSKWKRIFLNFFFFCDREQQQIWKLEYEYLNYSDFL